MSSPAEEVCYGFRPIRATENMGKGGNRIMRTADNHLPTCGIIASVDKESRIENSKAFRDEPDGFFALKWKGSGRTTMSRFEERNRKKSCEHWWRDIQCK